MLLDNLVFPSRIENKLLLLLAGLIRGFPIKFRVWGPISQKKNLHFFRNFFATNLKKKSYRSVQNGYTDAA
jgi:hypothetical protein